MQRPPLPLLLSCLPCLALLQLQLPMQSLSLLPLLLQFTYSHIHTNTHTHCSLAICNRKKENKMHKNCIYKMKIKNEKYKKHAKYI